MDRARSYKPLLVVLMIAGLVLAGFTQNRLDKQRADLGLTRLAPLENAPPMLAFTSVALGGFRGLIANGLWVRAMEMQDEGKYFEMVQLADWITKLQPHIATVWIAQAWNMSYNISVKFQSYRDRWFWVQRGITLLRDEALKYNPNDSQLYRELAWHFQHKMGANLDDKHLYYKLLWAGEMTQLLSVDQTNFTGHPNFDEFIKPTTPAYVKAAKDLREIYKMDPEVMKKVDGEYGPLDWRMPETHAIYWAYYGLSKSKNDELIKLRRVIYQSMQLAFQRGRLIANRDGRIREGVNPFGPNLDLIPNANKAYEEMMRQDPAQITQIRTGHRNFLRDAVYFLYANRRLTEANNWYKYLAEKYPTNSVMLYEDMLPGTIDMQTYALMRLQEDINETSVDRVTSALQGMIYGYFLDQLSGYDERAYNNKRMIQLVYDRYRKKIDTQEKRVGLNTLPELYASVLNELISTNSPLQPEEIAQLRTALRLSASATQVESAAVSTNSTLGSLLAPDYSTNAATKY